MTRSFSSPCIRSKLRRASSRCASTAASCARSCRVSSSASTSPSRTALPESNAIRSTVPGRSALTVTPCTAATVPIALKRGRPLLLLRHDRRHRFGGRLERRPLRDRRLNLLELHEAQARDEQRRHGQHHNHSFRHMLLPSSEPRSVS